MKKNLYIICASMMAVLGMSALSSCTQENPEAKEEGIVLTVSTVQPKATAAKTKAGEGRVDWNENKITSVYYFIYRAEETTTQPVLKGFFNGLNLNGDNPQKTWSIPVSSKTVLDDLFPTGRHQCHAFVVANPTAELAKYLEGSDSDLSLEKLYQYSFYSSLDGVQDTFVMTYEGDAELINRAGNSKGVVARIDAELKRLAVKLSMHAKVVPQYVDPETGAVWTPQVNGLMASFHNALSKTNLAGDFSNLDIQRRDFFDAAEAAFTNTTTATFKNSDGVEVTGTISDTSIPMYSYPMQWEFADRDEPYLFVELPWKKEWEDVNGTHESFQSCYYKIMFSLKRIDSNQWYNVVLTLDALGSFNKVEPVVQYLYEDYMVMDWISAYGSEANVEADIREARYLVVENNDYTIYDQEKLSIPYSTSHQCKVEVLNAKQANLKTDTDRNLTSAAAAWFSLSSTGSVIEFNHTLNNNLNGNLDITPYEFDIKISHADNSAYEETIHILQYPAITVSKILNSAVTRNANGSLSINYNRGYAYVNNTQPTTDDSASNRPYGTITQLTSTTGDNNCPYLHVINVRALAASEEYDIGDSRVMEVDNLGTWNPATTTAPSLYNNSNRRLTYYLPANKTSEGEASIAPKFMVASSFGKTLTLSKEAGEKRCAVYQEDGFPAGRWRLPTAAEVRFCVSLSYFGLIQSLFSSSSEYWCATGKASVSDNSVSIGNNSGSAYTRCVYDSWYWDEIDKAAGRTEADRLARKNTFTWGDQPR